MTDTIESNSPGTDNLIAHSFAEVVEMLLAWVGTFVNEPKAEQLLAVTLSDIPIHSTVLRWCAPPYEGAEPAVPLVHQSLLFGRWAVLTEIFRGRGHSIDTLKAMQDLLKIVPPPLNAAVPFSGLSLPKADSTRLSQTCSRALDILFGGTSRGTMSVRPYARATAPSPTPTTHLSLISCSHTLTSPFWNPPCA